MSAASTKTFLHYAQCLSSGNLQKYDYGPFFNLKHYGKFTPTFYNPANVHAPIALHYGDNDILDDVRDVEQIIFKILPNIVDKNRVHNYGHMDFVIAENVIEKVYERILASFNKYNSKYYFLVFYYEIICNKQPTVPS